MRLENQEGVATTMDALPRGHRVFIAGVTMAAAISVSGAANITAEAALYTYIFTNYNKEIRPIGDNGHSVSVRIHISLHQVTFLNAEQQALKNLVVITAGWTDDNLQWVPADHSNITHMILPASDFWLPDFGIENSAKSFYDEGSTDFRLELKHTGEIKWSFGGHVTTKCDVLVESFPFDKQVCQFAIANWMYDIRAVNISLIGTSMDVSEYVRNVEWNLITTHCESKEVVHRDRDSRVYPTVACIMVLRRKPTYYVINLFVPSYFMLALFLAAFCFPPGHRAVIPLQMTTLLIYLVMLLNISKQLPHTSHVPHITSFALVVIAMATLSIIFTTCISVIRIYMDTSYRVPQKIRIVAFKYFAMPLCLKSIAYDVHMKVLPVDDAEMDKTSSTINEVVKFVDENTNNDANNMKLDIEAGTTSEQQLLQRLVMLSEKEVQHLSKISCNTGINPRAAMIRAEWDLLSKISARLSFWFLLVIIVGLTIEFTLSISSQNANMYLGKDS